MQSLRMLLAAPFIIVASIAYLLLGLQLIVAIGSLLNGVGLGDVLLQWVLNTALLGILGTVAGVMGWAIRGPSVRPE